MRGSMKSRRCGGRAPRLVVAIDFEKGIVWIIWIGTHRDYDKIDVTKVRHGGA